MAYATVEDPDHPGRFFDVRMRTVFAEQVEFLEPNARSSRMPFARARLIDTMVRDSRPKRGAK